MQTLKRIKKRIVTARGTRKIVGAMKLISASKLKRIQKNLLGTRLYDDKLKELALQVAAKSGEITHPAFLLRPKPKKAIVLAITAERGLCGALSENTVKQIRQFLTMMKDRNTEVQCWVVGTRGAKAFKKHGIEFKELEIGFSDIGSGEKVDEICGRLLDMFFNEECDQVVLAYNRFLSAVSQEVTLDMFLPIWVKKSERPKFTDIVDFLFEPDKSLATDSIVRATLKSGFVRAMLEGKTSELAARMVSMDSAYRNATDMVNQLGREFHRIRQASITRELLDIVGGAEAVKNI